MKNAVRCLVLALAIGACAPVASDEDPAAISESAALLLADHVCAACHGARGISKVPAYPSLAAQPPEYLAAQIKAFRGRRHEPEGHEKMVGMSVALEEPTIGALTRYYAAQRPPKPRHGDPIAIAKGRRLYFNGDPDRVVPPCALCHGDDATGKSLVPRLAGQHAVYLTRQMRAIQSQDRNAPIMHPLIDGLTPRQIRALAIFLQAQ